MHKLHARLEHLERRAVAHLACHCWQVIRDDEPEQETCPHGRPWAGIIRLVHDERPDPA